MPASSCGKLFERTGERGDRQVDGSVLLHVEVDERPGQFGLGVDRLEPVDDPLHRRVERPRIELAGDRGDLDRDVVDVVAPHELQHPVAMPQRLALAEDGFAQQAEVEPVAAARSVRRWTSRAWRPSRRAPGGRRARAASCARVAGRGRVPASMPGRRTAGRDAPGPTGIPEASGASLCSACAAVAASSGRMTRSMNWTVKPSPAGSRSRAASRCAESSEPEPERADGARSGSIHVRTSSMLRSAREASDMAGTNVVRRRRSSDPMSGPCRP